MTDRIRLTFDTSIHALLATDDIVKLAESLYTFIDLGIIDCDKDEEIHIDRDYFDELIQGIELIHAAAKKYGIDESNLIKYPFWGDV
jgi:hypothetical protein